MLTFTSVLQILDVVVDVVGGEEVEGEGGEGGEEGGEEDSEVGVEEEEEGSRVREVVVVG